MPGMYIGDERLPVAMQGADGGVISLADRDSFKLQITGNETNRKKLIEDLNDEKRRGQGRPRRVRPQAPAPDLHEPPEDRRGAQRRRERRDSGTRTSSSTAGSCADDPNDLELARRQARPDRPADPEGPRHAALLRPARRVRHALRTRPRMHDEADRRTVELDRQLPQLAAASTRERVALMTYSEFGRRVKENGSRGTDHGSGSCMFVAGSRWSAGWSASTRA